jgi:N-terminal domain of unknown function (DUF4140)
MHLLIPVCLLLSIALPAAASPSRVTYFLDGARVEREAEAVQGRIEIDIPRGVEVESLRVKPLQGASISRVEFMTARPDRKTEKETARLAEKRDALSDRLKALEVKEEILRAAAKSQSAKSPRSTKSNSNPLETIRKGTEFAISRLEEVYRAQRQTEKEIKSLDARTAELIGAGKSQRCLVQVALAGKRGRVQISYRDPGLKWAPAYDFRLHDQGEVEIIMYALFPAAKKGDLISVAPGLFSENPVALPVAISPDGMAKVAVLRFPLEKEDFSPAPVSTVSFLFTNRSERKLPPGESTCYRRGEYIGKTRFEGSLPGDSKRLVFGNAPPAPK